MRIVLLGLAWGLLFGIASPVLTATLLPQLQVPPIAAPIVAKFWPWLCGAVGILVSIERSPGYGLDPGANL